MKNQLEIQKIEQQMREHAIAIITLHEKAKELLNSGSFVIAKKQHKIMLDGIIEYLTEPR